MFNDGEMKPKVTILLHAIVKLYSKYLARKHRQEQEQVTISVINISSTSTTTEYLRSGRRYHRRKNQRRRVKDI